MCTGCTKAIASLDGSLKLMRSSSLLTEEVLGSFFFRSVDGCTKVICKAAEVGLLLSLAKSIDLSIWPSGASIPQSTKLLVQNE